MGTPQSSSSRSTLAVVSLFLGCAACCALPLLASVGAAGAGAGFIGWLAGKPVLVAVAIGLVVFGLGLAWQVAARRRSTRTAETSCDTTCAVDRTCCAPSDNAGGDH